MSEVEFQGKDKVVSKMTRDGLTEDNVTQGTTERVSGRKEEFEYNEKEADYNGREFRRERACNESKTENESKNKHTKGAEQEEHESKNKNKKTSSKEENKSSDKTAKQSKSDDFDYSKKTKKVIKKAEKAERLRNVAYEKAPKKKRLKFDDKNKNENRFMGSSHIEKRRLHFEEKTNRKGDVILNPELRNKKTRRLQRRRMYRDYNEGQLMAEVDENAGIKGAYGTYRTIKFMKRRIQKRRSRQEDPIYQYQMQSRKFRQYSSQAEYRKFLEKNPQFDSREKFKQELQKRRFKKKFAKAYRETKNAEYATRYAQAAIIKSSRKVAETLKKIRSMLAIGGGAGILIIALMIMLFSCALLFGGISSVEVGSFYPSESTELTEADSYYTEKEADLDDYIKKVPENKLGYDEYRYHLDEIGHDQIALLSYLSVRFEDFTLQEVQAELDSIFEEQYELIFREETETRERSVYNPITEEYEIETYEWKILHITLIAKDFISILEGRLTSEEKERFDVYNDVQGGRNVFGNPFDINWWSQISSPFGWRIHPISGEKKFHTGVDIAMPGGTPIKAVMSGTVVIATYSSSAGNYVAIQDKDGYLTKYMHCQAINVRVGDEIKKGDLVGWVGSTGNSTGNHLHLDVIDSNGNYLNPVLMVSNYIGQVN